METRTFYLKPVQNSSSLTFPGLKSDKILKKGYYKDKI